LIEHDLLVLENSLEKPLKEEEVSDKLSFVQPFMRFWFSSISPYYKGIKQGDYSEMKARWAHSQQGFSDLTYTKLAQELVKKSFIEDPIVSIGGYWDKQVNIDILAKTKSGKMLAGACKFSKAKAGKNDLAKLKEDCAKAALKIDYFVVFSKNKFSNELKKEKGGDVLLLSPRNIKVLLNDLSEKDFLINKNKKH